MIRLLPFLVVLASCERGDQVTYRLEGTTQVAAVTVHGHFGTVHSDYLVPMTYSTTLARGQVPFIEAEGLPHTLSCSISVNGKVVAKKVSANSEGTVVCRPNQPSQ